MDTMMRVPLMHGFPWQTLGLIEIRLRQSTVRLRAIRWLLTERAWGFLLEIILRRRPPWNAMHVARVFAGEITHSSILDLASAAFGAAHERGNPNSQIDSAPSLAGSFRTNDPSCRLPKETKPVRWRHCSPLREDDRPTRPPSRRKSAR